MLQRPTMLMRAIFSYLWDRRLYPALYVPFYYPSVPNFLLAEAYKRRSVGQNFYTRRRTEWQVIGEAAAFFENACDKQ